MKKISEVSKQLALAPVRLYQIAIGPLLPKVCVFEPSCSEYTRQAIEKYGALKGSWMGAQRIARCHPWQHNHYDPVP